MAGLQGRIFTLFSGFRRALTTATPRYQAPSLPRHPLCPSITRLLSVQRPAESVPSAPSSASQVQGIDRALYRIDTDIRRTGRIFLRDIEDIFGEIKALKYASSTQSLLLLRCCGSLVPEEKPEVRNKLVQEIWDTLHELRIPLDVSHYNTLLRVYLENDHKFSPTEFLAQLERDGIEPNRVTYQRLISRYCQDGDIEGATKILEFMKEKQLPVGENIFNALIMGHARANDLSSARGVLEVMRGSGLEPSSDSYAVLLASYAEAGDAEGLQRTLEECQTAELTLHDRELLDTVLALARNGHSHLIPQLLDKLEKQQGYTQDAMNTIYRLVNHGCHQEAYQVFSTMPMPQPVEGHPHPQAGAFFIKHLVKSDTPMTTVVQYCQEIKQQGSNLRTLETALNTALTSGQPDKALFTMRVMLEEGLSVRSHYFWPIILHYAKLGDSQKIYDTAKEMLTLGNPITLETLKNYIVPGTVGQGISVEEVITSLKGAGVPAVSIINGIVAYFLEARNLERAAMLVTKSRMRLRPPLRRDLADVYVKTGDAKAAVVVLGQMIQFPQGLAEEAAAAEEEGHVEEEEEEGVTAHREQQQERDVAGLFLLDVVGQCQRTNLSQRILPLLLEMEGRGISISLNSSATLKARLKDRAEQSILDSLNRMSSGDLTFQPLSRTQQEPYSQTSVEELERRLAELESKNLPTTSLCNHLLLTYIRSKNLEKAEQFKQRLEDEQCPLGTGVYVLLMDMYVGAGRLEDAIATLRKLEVREPDSRLTPLKFLRLATLMAQEGQVEEAVKVIETHSEQSLNASAGADLDANVLTNIARRMLDMLVERGGLEPAQRALDHLLAHKVIQPSTVIFTPLIKGHLEKDDLGGALSEFENVARNHHVTPYKQELTARCIMLEDGDRLQRIMDLSIEVHGELNSLYDMVFAFVECGRVRQAKKLIETPGLRAFNNKLDQKCRWLKDLGKVNELESLVAVTKDIFDIDRNMMYTHLLRAHVKQNDPEKALGVWTSMQEENQQPSDDFLLELGAFLTASGREVPFALPETKPTPARETQRPASAPQGEDMEVTTPKGQYRLALRNKNWTTALALKKEIESSGGQLSISEVSDLVEGLAQEARLSEASEVARRMMAAGIHPTVRVLKFLLMLLAGAGEVETFIAFDKFVTDHNLKKRLNYDNLACTAYTIAGRSQEVLDQLGRDITNASDSTLQELAANFPRGGILGVLDKQPELMPQVLTLMEQYAARGLTDPANCVWMYLFSKGQYNEAEEVYKKHLATTRSMLMFRSILQTAHKTSNPALLPRLLQVLHTHPGISAAAQGVVYSSWIDLLNQQGKFEESLEVLNGALKTVELSNIATNRLVTLKVGLENTGKTFPHTIPPKERRDRRRSAVSSSSSSSSDSD